MDNNFDNDGSKTIKVGDVDITININHHDDSGPQQSGGAPQSAPAYAPPVRKRRFNKNVISIIVICFCLMSIPIMFNNYSSITPSTHARREISSGIANEKDYYTDEIGWIDNKNTLIRGMDEFYNETGVLPYVYITNTVNGSQSPTEQQLKEYADSLYGSLFTDEAHLLVVFMPLGNSFMESAAYGTLAAKVIDAEAETILREYLNYYYSDSSYTNSEAISKAFSYAADRMMSLTASPWVVTLICIPTIAIVGYFYIRRLKKQRKEKDDLSAQEVTDLLSIPLEKFGDPEVEELAKKYDDNK